MAYIFLMSIKGYSQSLPKAQKYKNKLDRKVILSPFIGLGILPQNQSFNQFGDRKNIYADFKPVIALGLAASYPIPYVKQLYANAELSILISKQAYYLLNINAANIGAKYLLRDPRKKLNPYIVGGISLPTVIYSQQSHNEAFTPVPGSTDIGFGDHPLFFKRIPEKNVIYGPSISPYIGAGLQFKIDKKFSVFLQYNFYPPIGKSKKIQDNFPTNEAALQYQLIRGGVNIQLMKPKPPYVDTAMIPIPDAIAALSVSEDFLKHGMLVREGVFDIILREGLKHNIHLEVGDHDLIVEESVQDPCKVVCYLYNQNGEIISRAESTPEGKIVFSDLEKGVYDLTFVLQQPCKEANFTYKFPDPNVHPLMQYNTDGTITDSVTYNVEGKVMIPDSGDFNFIYNSSALFVAANNKMTNNNFDITVMQVDESGRVIHKMEPGKDEKFIFKKSGSINSDIIYKVPDAEIKTGITYTIYDNYKMPVKQITLLDTLPPYVPPKNVDENAFYEKLRFNYKGKISILDSSTRMTDVTLYLVNEKKKIVNIIKPQKDGTFIFKNLKSKNDYKVYYELDNPDGKVSMLYNPEEPLIKTLPDMEVHARRMVPDLNSSDDQILEYDIKGTLIDPLGYGIQVGAYENIINVDILCKKLKKDGFNDIAIMVGMTSKLNKKYNFTRDFKIHKILVGEYQKERDAKKIQQKLDYYGYDTYVVRHRKGE